MVTQFDDKGKFFTNVISKKTIQVTIQLKTHRIHGNVHVRPEERLKDEMDRSLGFIAVTSAEVFSVDGNNLEFQTDFMLVNNHEIIWITPDEDIVKSEPDHE